jgi:hypothetical protein
MPLYQIALKGRNRAVIREDSELKRYLCLCQNTQAQRKECSDGAIVPSPELGQSCANRILKGEAKIIGRAMRESAGYICAAAWESGFRAASRFCAGREMKLE